MSCKYHTFRGKKQTANTFAMVDSELPQQSGTNPQLTTMNFNVNTDFSSSTSCGTLLTPNNTESSNVSSKYRSSTETFHICDCTVYNLILALSLLNRYNSNNEIFSLGLAEPLSISFLASVTVSLVRLERENEKALYNELPHLFVLSSQLMQKIINFANIVRKL